MVKLTVRLPDDLHGALVEAAAREGRSLNGQVVWLLAHSYTAGPLHPDRSGEPALSPIEAAKAEMAAQREAHARKKDAELAKAEAKGAKVERVT
jgi:hypothetical protein